MKNLIWFRMLLVSFIFIPFCLHSQEFPGKYIFCVDKSINFSKQVGFESPLPAEGEERLKNIEDAKETREYRQFLDHCYLMPILRQQFVNARLFIIYNPAGMEDSLITYAEFKNKKFHEPTHVLFFRVGVMYQPAHPVGGRFILNGRLRIERVDKGELTGAIWAEVTKSARSDELGIKVESQDDWYHRSQCIEKFGESLAVSLIDKIRPAGKAPEEPAKTVKETLPKPQKKEVSSDGRYWVSQDGVIHDTKTNLEWLVGPDKNTTWDDVKAWVDSLTVGGGGWRMPTKEELLQLYQNGKGTRNIDPVFQTTGWWVWTGQLEDSSRAWEVYFVNGYVGCYDRSNLSKAYRGFSVRAGKQ
jgi:hypothetical protein